MLFNFKLLKGVSNLKKKLLEKIKQDKNPSKNVPIVPKHFFKRPHVPPPYVFNGKPENKKHYEYKVYLGETLRDNLPFLKIDYEFTGLPSFFSGRHNKFVNYQPDIFVEWNDDGSKTSFFSDIEINGLIHYKNKEQILKIKERMNCVYPLLHNLKAVGKEDYRTIPSYIIIDKDDFEYQDINEIYKNIKFCILRGGIAPKGFQETLEHMLKVAN